MTGHCEFFMVTFHRDFPYLKFCLRSIHRFASGFSGVTILVPDCDLEELQRLVGSVKMELPVICLCGNEWPDKGFLWHACEIMHADGWCPTSQFIAHLDPDCIFTAPVTPETFIKDGKPILCYESYATRGKRWPGVLNWKEPVEQCLPFTIEHDFMCCMPIVHHRSLYEKTQDLIEKKTGRLIDEYVRSCRNENPMTFAEFPTLGAVAYHCFWEQYALRDLGQQLKPDLNPFPLLQLWAQGVIDRPQEIIIEGQPKTVVPIEVIKEIGLL